MTTNNQDYAARFDRPIAFIMGALIILAFFGVIALQKATHPECTENYYTYCDPQPDHHK